MNNRRWSEAPHVAALFALALLIRLPPLSSLLGQGGQGGLGGRLYFGTDPYDHMRRVQLILEDFPRLPAHNFYQGYPEGTPMFLSPLFDFLIALTAWVVGLGNPSNETVQLVGILLPAVLGALAVLAVYLLAREYMGHKASLIAAIVMAVLPGYLFYSFAGLPDNNVAEPAIAALYFLFLIRALKGGRGRDTLYASAMGVVSILMWRGASIFWAAAAAALAVHLIFVRDDREQFMRALGAGKIMFIVQGLTLLAMAKLELLAVSNSMSFREVSAFHAALSLTAGLSFFAAQAAGQYTRHFMAAALGALITVPALTLLLLPSFTGELARAASMMGQGDVWLRDNLEYKPMLYPKGILELMHPAGRLSLLFWALPPGVVWFVVRAIRRPAERAAMAVLAVITVVFFVSTVSHTRFENLLAICVALLTGLLAGEFVIEKERSFRKAAVSLLLLAAFVPVISPIAKYSTGRFRMLQVQGEFFEAMHWIRDNTPPTSHFLSPHERPEYGILAEWSIGTWIENVAERPTVATNFGAETYGLGESIRFLLSTEEDEAEKILERNNVRYVIITNLIPSLDTYARIIGQNGGGFARLAGRGSDGAQWVPESRYFNLVSTSLLLKDGARASTPFKQLRRFRLLFESTARLKAVGLREPVSKIKVFEFVKGARLGGRARPGQSVSVSVNIVTNLGRAFTYRDETLADQSGAFTLALPYSTGAIQNSTSAAGPYTVIAGDRTYEVGVTEEAVINGLVVGLSE